MKPKKSKIKDRNNVKYVGKVKHVSIQAVVGYL